ncbi:cell cycle checkpoint protein RAD1 [Zootermopsis nevadensis]|uniref:Cell cycle checkpoint protein RAD1 n=1 Tax=Zootermopsis nevadensis TaxID=136037 RepID=A0A067QQH9_ZOONE|nr:cell cycle checkpoint protein RAD1 [Zootermopsis nevadensis]KDR12148.1 Cell cycle checkpoint protein RAD1 [Zootermopsis nevadensis]
MSVLSQHDDVEDFLFEAYIDSVKHILTLLKAVNFKDNATCFATNKGLKVTVEDSKCVQASSFIQREMFQHYKLNDVQVTFKVNISILVECLNIFGGSATALKVCYQGYGFPLRMLLEEGGVITDCSIKTSESEEILDFNFSAANVLNKIILRSECLKEVFAELDSSSDLIEILLSPDPPYFRITTAGTAGDTKIDIPKNSGMIETFQCTTLATSRYRLSHVKPSAKSLAVSQKVSIRTDDRGLLCFQYMIPADNHTCFIEYCCTPIADIDDYDE